MPYCETSFHYRRIFHDSQPRIFFNNPDNKLTSTNSQIHENPFHFDFIHLVRSFCRLFPFFSAPFSGCTKPEPFQNGHAENFPCSLDIHPVHPLKLDKTGEASTRIIFPPHRTAREKKIDLAEQETRCLLQLKHASISFKVSRKQLSQRNVDRNE